MAGEAATTSGGKMVTLRSSDGEEFEVKAETIAAASATIKNVLEDDCAGGGIPLPNVTGPILARVVEYCNRHYADADAAANPLSSVADDFDPSLERFDAEFIGGVDQETLFDLIDAANYLHVQKLLDLTCKTVADQIRGKSPEEIRAHFHIVNDYTEEEEEEARRENSWAFE